MRTRWVILLPFLCSISVFADSAAGLRWSPPAGWTTAASRPMRAATYTVTPPGGDRAAAECAIYFFGTGQGGTVDANIARWKGQFRDPDGKPAAARVATRTAHGLTITTVDVTGTYSGMGGPMAAGHAAVEGYRLLGAIVEGPQGNVFVKFTGPAKTIADNQRKFEQLLGSFQSEK